MEINIKFNKPRQKSLIITISGLLAVGLIFLFFQIHDTSTIPSRIRQQLSFKTIYPPASNLTPDQNSFNYQSDQKSLSFNVHYQGLEVSFTEQPAPDSLASGSQVYFQSLGLHPTAQFESKVGPVAIANFYKPGTLESNGQAAILVAQGTMVIAHPVDNNQKLANDQWKSLFDSLKLSR